MTRAESAQRRCRARSATAHMAALIEDFTAFLRALHDDVAAAARCHEDLAERLEDDFT